ncbi:MAG: TauD/TfdA family dioxygenase [Magnetospirillum sp.]|nr:TauD/TfdA family dioxygenase [Magnetospirillum sp.]
MTESWSGAAPARHFSLENSTAYAAWRDLRLANQPPSLADLIVEVERIDALSDKEHAALMDRIRRCNFAVYAERHPVPGRDDKNALRALGLRFGLTSLDCNTLADEDGVTPLSVHRDGPRSRYIPYTERPIAWHTDGYYNHPPRQVRALTLHCASPAAEGGANRLMDYELLYIMLRDEDPAHIAALTREDAMTIPGNDEDGIVRAATPGPVFWFDNDGRLAMRYTARARNVEWNADPAVQRAAAAIRRILDDPSAPVFQGRLEAGQGLVSNNVLHTREPFRDDPAHPRLLYRARYHDRIAGS